MIVISKNDNDFAIFKINELLHNNVGINYFKTGRFSIWHDKGFNVVQQGSKSILMSGEAYSYGRRLKPVESQSSHILLNDIRRASGSFVVACIDDNTVTVTRSLYKSKDIFFSKFQGGTIIASSLRLLAALHNNNVSINENYCLKYLTDTSTFGSETIFDEIEQVLLGESITTDGSDHLKRDFHNRPFKTSDNVIDDLKNELSTLTNHYNSISLMFSGGLDSGSIAYLLTELDIPFVPTHSRPQQTLAESEEDDAVALAADLGITVSFFDEDPARQEGIDFDLNSRPDTPNPYDMTVFGTMPAVYGPLANGNRLVLAGHGGDNVFYQNPTKHACADAVRDFGWLAGFKEIVKLNRLKQENLFDLIRFSAARSLRMKPKRAEIPNWICTQKTNFFMSSNREYQHYLLHDLDPESGKYRHVRGILAGLERSGSVHQAGYHLYSPLLFPSVIGHVIDTPVYRLYDSVYERASFRNAIFARSGLNFAWRRTKRPSSSAIFDRMQKGGSRLLEAVVEGQVARRINIQSHQLTESIIRSSKIGAQPDLWAVFALFQLEKLVTSTLK